MFNFSKTFLFPFKYQIPNYVDKHIQEISKLQRIIKYFKRNLFLYIKSQKNLEIFSILPNHQNILWINISAPSLGDSLMDLSSRVMLENKNVDLFTSNKNAHIYVNDEIFKNVFTSKNELINNSYDLVILDSYSTRSVNIKVKVAPSNSFVGMYGFFNGPEVNRILFSYHQLNNLLGYVKSESEINNIAKNILSISDSDKRIVADIVPKEYLAISIGGEWKYKIYEKWGDLIQKIIKNNEKINIVLIGSKNAQNQSQELINRFNNYQFINLVSTLTFNQTAEVIKRSKVLICCDGGLMHAANAVNANIIALIARLRPEMLFVNDNQIALFDKNDVNNIEVETVFKSYSEISNLFDNHLQGE